MDQDELQERCYQFALRVVRMTKTFKFDLASKCIAQQLIRSSTSVSANYRATRRARSGKEFLSKLSIVVEEADESNHWISMAIDTECIKKEKAQLLLQESEELMKIFARMRATTITNNKKT